MHLFYCLFLPWTSSFAVRASYRFVLFVLLPKTFLLSHFTSFLQPSSSHLFLPPFVPLSLSPAGAACVTWHPQHRLALWTDGFSGCSVISVLTSPASPLHVSAFTTILSWRYWWSSRKLFWSFIVIFWEEGEERDNFCFRNNRSFQNRATLSLSVQLASARQYWW